jgi:hypothetical protein
MSSSSLHVWGGCEWDLAGNRHRRQQLFGEVEFSGQDQHEQCALRHHQLIIRQDFDMSAGVAIRACARRRSADMSQ